MPGIELVHCENCGKELAKQLLPITAGHEKVFCSACGVLRHSPFFLCSVCRETGLECWSKDVRLLLDAERIERQEIADRVWQAQHSLAPRQAQKMP